MKTLLHTRVYSSSALKNEGPSNILNEEVRSWRHACFLLEGDVRMQERKDMKERLLDHLRNNTYIELRPSSIHGIRAFALQQIPAGVDPFQTSGEVSQETLDLTEEDMEALYTRARWWAN
jgi:hypothetical protein